MTAKELVKEIGKKGSLQFDHTISFFVEVTDARMVFGKLQYEVKPVEGFGTLWIKADRLTNIRLEA